MNTDLITGAGGGVANAAQVWDARARVGGQLIGLGGGSTAVRPRATAG